VTPSTRWSFIARFADVNRRSPRYCNSAAWQRRNPLEMAGRGAANAVTLPTLAGFSDYDFDCLATTWSLIFS
jgi:hypothetical protein